MPSKFSKHAATAANCASSCFLKFEKVKTFDISPLSLSDRHIPTPFPQGSHSNNFTSHNKVSIGDSKRAKNCVTVNLIFFSWSFDLSQTNKRVDLRYFPEIPNGLFEDPKIPSTVHLAHRYCTRLLYLTKEPKIVL